MLKFSSSFKSLFSFHLQISLPIGPNGEIGKRIKSINDNLQPFALFETIDCNIPDLPRHLFEDKTDLICFFDLAKGITTGFIHPKYVKMKMPNMSIVRWRQEQIN